jgi:hypothetical protein
MSATGLYRTSSIIRSMVAAIVTAEIEVVLSGAL